MNVIMLNELVVKYIRPLMESEILDGRLVSVKKTFWMLEQVVGRMKVVIYARR